MKIELIKSEQYDGTWFKVIVDYSVKYFRSESEADEYYKMIVEKAQIPEVQTVLKSIEI